MDYQGNSHKETEGLAAGKPAKETPQKIVTTEVVVQKRSIGRKMRDIFVEADFRSVTRYIVHDVLIPAMRNLIVDTTTKGIERAMYGDNAARRYQHPGPRYNYNNPIGRPYAAQYPSPPGRNAPPTQIGPRSSVRQAREDIIVGSREEGQAVLDQMSEIADQYEVVSVADLNALLGLTSTHVDNKWGWVFVGNASVRQVREGYLIDLPPAEPIS